MGGVTLARCSRTSPTAVLTFDDAVASHRRFVAPYLADLGFSATFFVTHRWMDDRDNFMSWEDIAEIAEMGFEIGNHSWSHPSFAVPRNAARMEGELALVENELAKVGVPKPVSFAWCGNHFGPEALQRLRGLGYRFGRRGLSPELGNRALEPGLAFDATRHDRLLIPSTGNSVPGWSLDLFRRILERSSGGVVVLQFHGVPDLAHEWVHTPPALFRDCMQELKTQGFRVQALRDLEEQVPAGTVNDANATLRNPDIADSELEHPTELVQTRADLPRWTEIMARHRFGVDEAVAAADLSGDEISQYRETLSRSVEPVRDRVEIRAFPGGRHPRIGFLEGAVDPLRGTKTSVFLPWDPDSYVVVDNPELITSEIGHLFLAHTHVPTIWNERNQWIENVDQKAVPGGGLDLEWALPNGVVFGSSLRARRNSVEMDLWLRNGLKQRLEGLRTQICVMLGAAIGFNTRTSENKIFEPPVAAVRSENGSRWILTAWERSGRCWGNVRCPCLHSDPVFPDCDPGATVRLRGRLWFHQGDSIESAVESAASEFGPLAAARQRVQRLPNQGTLSGDGKTARLNEKSGYARSFPVTSTGSRINRE